MSVVRAGEYFELHVEPGGGRSPPTQAVLEGAAGGVSLTSSRRGETLVLSGTLPEKALGSRSRVSSVWATRTTSSGDAPAFLAALTPHRGAAGLPTEDLGLLDATRFPSWFQADGAAILDAGGIRRLPVRLVNAQGTTTRVALPVAGRAQWMYVSGHYYRREADEGHGARLFGAPLTPSSVEGSRWKDHLKVLVMAACNAGEISGPSGERLVSRGVLGPTRDGAEWWKKFQGTLLAYRSAAPTKGATEIAQEVVKRFVASGVSPSDPDAWSTRLAETWMDVNLEKRATYATALDSRGRYYFTRGTWIALRGEASPNKKEGFWRRQLPEDVRMLLERARKEGRWFRMERKVWESQIQ
jgi:hypothetical protein